MSQYAGSKMPSKGGFNAQPYKKFIFTGPVPPVPIAFSKAILHPDGKIRIYGGIRAANNQEPVLQFDPINLNWTTKAAHSGHGSENDTKNRSQKYVELPDGRVMAMVGGAAPYNHVQIYDYTLNTWTEVAPVPIVAPVTDYQADFPQIVLLNSGKVMAYGGRDGTPHWNTSIFIYDPALDTWTTSLATIQTADVGTTSYGSTAWADGFGNIILSVCKSTQTYKYDELADTITAAYAFPSSLASIQEVATNGTQVVNISLQSTFSLSCNGPQFYSGVATGVMAAPEYFGAGGSVVKTTTQGFGILRGALNSNDASSNQVSKSIYKINWNPVDGWDGTVKKIGDGIYNTRNTVMIEDQFERLWSFGGYIGNNANASAICEYIDLKSI
jgi:hypothetical protein